VLSNSKSPIWIGTSLWISSPVVSKSNAIKRILSLSILFIKGNKILSLNLWIFLDNAIVLQKGNRKNIIKYNMERKIVIDVIQRKLYCISWGIY
jgi:hypothetical protein